MSLRLTFECDCGGVQILNRCIVLLSVRSVIPFQNNAALLMG